MVKIIDKWRFEDYAFLHNQMNIAGHIFTPTSEIGSLDSLLHLPLFHSFIIQNEVRTVQVGESLHVARDAAGLLVRCKVAVSSSLKKMDPNFLPTFRTVLPWFALTYGSVPEANIEILTSGEVIRLPIFSFWVYAPPPNLHTTAKEN